MRNMRRPLKDRFWEKVACHEPNSCWEWIGAKSKAGYGMIQAGGRLRKLLYAHRLSWEYAFGPIPCNKYVLHHCDNPGCINPKHLFLGTQADNIADMCAKGRHSFTVFRGEKHGNAKLTEKEIIAIRNSPLSERKLGRIYGVYGTTIGKIKRRESWAHVKAKEMSIASQC